ncbi:hypothetical protein HanIR_Chr17g0896701 [Helianthus annuus]|nr:hypothetical protein HanIR_Chr17g0896701 [Helianthus annuus]
MRKLQFFLRERSFRKYRPLRKVSKLVDNYTAEVASEVGGCPTPNFYMPMLSPSQQAPHPGGSCVDVPGKQNQQQPILHT